MSELKELINKIFENEIKKAVISKPVSKQAEFKKITISRMPKFFQIAKHTEKQVFHENVQFDEAANRACEFMGNVFLQIQRVLKDNGSFYFFHNDFLQICELQNFINKNTDFIFKQLLVWNKRFNEAKNKGFLDGYCEVENLRNYQKMVEYCLYYTFQDETGLTTVMLDTNNFPTLRKYFKELQEYLGVTKKQIIEKIGQKADHCFRWGSSQWDLPTRETYQELIDVFNIKSWLGFRTYESLRQEYESLRQEYESLRYTFNNLKKHHSVMNYEIAPKYGHTTPKPLALLEYIIQTSSNENEVVLDCFMGSGSTGVACVNTYRNFIGIELDETYYNIAKERIDAAIKQVHNASLC
jgi:site-specific DNA-methyltransferase (adenine-specific)